ncbi:MAG: DUF3300 domain-containing protein [Syntrophobacter sp.]
MNKKVFYLRFLVGFLVLLMAVPPWTLAQSSGIGAFRQEELDQMLAPVALYPDSLLGQILVAATYPDQVMEADQWLGQHKRLHGDELNVALDGMDWDLSVKALVPFPQVLSMMSDKREWTQRLGDAFLAGQADVMDTIQRLRARAHAQGNLNSTDQLTVAVRGESIEIEPANPRLIYVPTYNPTVIYGPWWYPSYPPYAYSPYYPNYAYDPYYTGAGFVTAGLFGFAAGIAVGSIWNSGWGRWDWDRRNVDVTVNRTININRNDIGSEQIRTSNFREVNRQRGAVRSDRGAVGQAGNQRAVERAAVGTRVRPTAESVNQGLKQRGNNAQVRQGQTAGQRGQARVGAARGESSGQPNAQVRQGQAARQRGQARVGTARGKSSGQSNAQVRRSTTPGTSQGGSLRSGTSRRGGNSIGKADAARSGGGGKAAVSRAPRAGGGGGARAGVGAPRGGGGGAAAVSRAPRGGNGGGGAHAGGGGGGGGGHGQQAKQ